MRALLYADWCVVKSTIGRLLLVCLLVASPMVLMSQEDPQEASGIIVATLLVMMTLFYACIDLFGMDETFDWEQVRLALPTTPRQVVRARYAFVALTALVATILGTVLGGLVELLLAQGRVPAGMTAPLELAQGAMVASVLGLASLAPIMPIAYRLGIRKGRMFFALPFFLTMLLNVEAVRIAVSSLVERVLHLVEALGSPAPLYAAGAVLALGLYLASMLLSERLYAAREL